MESIPEMARKLDADRREAAEAMTFGQRLLAGADMFDVCIMMLRAGIRMNNPEADDEDVERMVVERLRAAGAETRGQGVTYSPQAVLSVIDALNESGSPYILTGSLATNVYGEPRATLDADFVVEMTPDQLEELFARLSKQLDREPQMSFETVTGKAQHKFRHRPTKFVIEIFEARMDDPHERSRFERRREGAVEGRPVFVPTMEDVIIQKLRWFKQIRRVKDREDVRNVLLYQWPKLDWAYIEHWCREHGSIDHLEELRSEVRAALAAQQP